ncbi:extracellular solute-binding protein [Paenibacillus psychroresistens]|uniref:Extracellular solute-binding protein n=1 Tax=Paenibacillus psychroresistens TaxID=1778678 RepID=A0A6B8RWN9_9BACL|nr:extracellular solute-binding protein [Paenibacillus psychroresistens]QGQ99793.1 extracellular solute-binding protein [Paenibacillus psychroresistens]
MKKKFSLMISAALIVSLMAGCSSKNTTDSSSAAPTASEAGNTETKANEPMVTLKYVVPGTEPKSYKETIAEVNKKLIADGLNVQVEQQYIDWGAWEQKINIMLSTHEDFDMFQVMNDFISLSNYIGRGALQDITKSMDEFGTDIKKVIPNDVFSAVKKDGKLYGIPSNWYEPAQDTGFTTNDLLFKKYNISSDFKTPQELLDASVKLYNAAPAPKPIFPSNFSSAASDVLNRTFDSFPFDVRDSVAMINKDGKVSNWIESDEFKQEAAFWHEAYTKKLMNPDILVMTGDAKNKAIKDGNWPFSAGTYGAGYETFKASFPDATKDSLSYRKFNPEKGNYRFVNAKNVNVVTAQSKHPEAAVKFLNWLYTNQENYDLFLYGVDGKSYKKVGDKGIEMIIDPATKSPLSLNVDWMVGNVNFIRQDSGAMTSDLSIFKVIPDAKSFISSGFFFDSTPVKGEMANVKAAIASDIIPIFSGVVSYDSHIKVAADKLKSAGIDKVLAEYQKQMDAYMASAK